MTRGFTIVSFALIGGFLHVVSPYDNGLGRTPPMGWNSWNYFGCDINEAIIRETANVIVETNLSNIGYQYVNIDDCWQIARSHHDHHIVEDPLKFPSGMSVLSDFVHSLGLKFGLYSDAGIWTCQRRPGSLGFEKQDAAFYAKVKIDYLKYDNCFNPGLPAKLRYKRMHNALNATGRPIFFHMCEWGEGDPATWAEPLANAWRTTGDIEDRWDSVLDVLDRNNRWHKFAGPGGWNDPDMLEVGNGGLTHTQDKSHFTLWCLIKAPLILGNDLRSMSQETLEIISNKEIILVNQDPLGIQGYKVVSEGGLEVWTGALVNGSKAVVLFNRSRSNAEIAAYWNQIGIPCNGTEMHARDLWLHKSLGIYQESISFWVAPDDVVALRLSLVSDQTISTACL